MTENDHPNQIQPPPARPDAARRAVVVGMRALAYICTTLLIYLMLMAAFAHADTAPVSGLCYSTDGSTVTTTYLGGDPYPVPVSAEVHLVDGGWEVVHRALFRRMRVWLPQVQK